MLTIQIPNTYEPERRYILSVLLKEFLGLDFQIQITTSKGVLITRDDGHQLFIADGLFNTPSEQWLNSASLPQQPLKSWDLATTSLEVTTVEPQIPIIYGDNPMNPEFFCQSDRQIYLGLDIFGSAFFMLSRYEEIVKLERDRHDRFPATASLAYQEGFLDRPIINEYLEILWACLNHLWPGLQRKFRQLKIHVSHDVDEPFRYRFAGIPRLIRLCAKDVVKHRDPLSAVTNIPRWFQVRSGGLDADPCNTFDRIMDISERNDLTSAFYFITADSGGDSKRYSIHHPLIGNLLRKIYQRGHEIGLHTSYNTYKNAAQTKKEFEILKEVCAEEGIQQDHWGGRQHYLRWQTPVTLQNWEDAGLDYDSTLSFADVAGFRCGVCYEFPAFNLKTRQTLKLRERPLIVMECTILDEDYMNLGGDDEIALQTMAKYKQRCRLFKGDFTLLWHNSCLTTRRELKMYEQVVFDKF